MLLQHVYRGVFKNSYLELLTSVLYETGDIWNILLSSKILEKEIRYNYYASFRKQQR